MALSFREVTETEKFGKEELLGRLIKIYWDGDDVFYSAKIKSYNPANDTFMVKYENDDEGPEYEENLRDTIWRISDGTSDDYKLESSSKVIHTKMQSNIEAVII